MSSRPRLKNHAQPLRRGPGSLQLGLSPDAGVVLTGLSDAEIAMAEGLDGSMDLGTLYAVAAAAGISSCRVSVLMAILNEHRLLVDTDADVAADPDVDTGRFRGSPVDEPRRYLLRPDARAIAAAYDLKGDGFDHIAARFTRHVVISGEGDLPSALADLLRASGIGRVSVGANAVNALDLELRGHWPRPAHRPIGAMADLADLPAHPVHPHHPDHPDHPDLVVLAAVGAIRPDAGEPWLRRGIPHLPVVAQGHRVQVGPLITRDDGPCLSCMDLHRCDRDGAWPAVLSQLAPGWPLLPGAHVNLENTLTALTIGAAAMIVNTCLDGQPVARDVALELSLPYPTVLSRRWFRHPLCACTAGHVTMAG